MDDFYKDFCKNRLKLKSRQGLSDEQLEYFATIISWNIWQMDGLKYVRPMSCRDTVLKPLIINNNQQTLLPSERIKKTSIACEGCRLGNPLKHTGQLVVIKDWTRGGKTGRNIKFLDLISKKSNHQ